jgi:hypothetical protein
MSVILLPPSEVELQDAIDFYNDQMVGLGDLFYRAFQDTIRYIEATPTSWRKVGSHTRRVNINRFPFLLLYVYDERDILITCIAHQHRDPEYYTDRMK